MTREELEDLQEIEKDFDRKTAWRIYEAGYRKVFGKYTCQRCGEKFTGHIDGSLHAVKFKTDGKELTMGRVRLCPACYLILSERRDRVDDRFFSELKSDGKTSGIAGKM